MADGYARVAGRPGVCMAQSVGAANLAAGLQDAWLGRSPVIAFSGRKEPAFQHRNAYQEIPHALLFAAVTKFSSPVESTADLPRVLRHAWRAALAETPRPTHLLVLFIGCDTGDQVTLNWQIPPLTTPIVQIEADPLEIGRGYPNTTGLVGDPQATVARLVHLVGRPPRNHGFAEDAAQIVAAWRTSVVDVVTALEPRAPEPWAPPR